MLIIYIIGLTSLYPSTTHRSVINESALMNWNLSVASEAFALFQEHVCTLLFKHGGYLVRSTCARCSSSMEAIW
jgi:hypothetical protein